MGSVRRLAALFVLPLLIIAGLTATTMNSASASPGQAGALSAAAPTQMSYACALKSGGLLRYVTSTSKCLKAETPVTISPGPNYVCIHQNDFAYLVSSLNSCPVPKNKAALTLPPSSSPDYFCAVAIIGTLTYATDPKKCLPIIEFPVVVPVPHSPPVLANIETTALAYTGGSGPAAVTSTLTVSSSDATTLAGATVSIGAGFVAAEDSLGFTSQNGITGSYNASTGVLTLAGTASLANYQAALRSVTYADSNAQAATSARTVSFQVNDGASANNLSNTESRAVDVAPVPHIAPVLANIETSAARLHRGQRPGRCHRDADGEFGRRDHAGGRDGVDQRGVRRGRGLARVHEPERDHGQLQRDDRGADAGRHRVTGELPDGAALGHLRRLQRAGGDVHPHGQLPG